MKLIIIKIVLYLIVGIFTYMGFKEIYPLVKYKFKLNYRFFIGLVYISTSIAMLISGSFLPMLIGAIVALTLKITLAIDKSIHS